MYNFTPSYVSNSLKAGFPQRVWLTMTSLEATNTRVRWFSVVMGTGMISTALNTLPYNGRWLYWISIVVFVLNVAIFAVCSILSVLRYTMYPETLNTIMNEPAQSMFLSTFPMGLATIVNMICFVCVPAWGNWTRDFAWALWMVDVCLSVISALYLPFSL